MLDQKEEPNKNLVIQRKSTSYMHVYVSGIMKNAKQFLSKYQVLEDSHFIFPETQKVSKHGALSLCMQE